MAHIVTEEELQEIVKDILNNPDPPTMWGFGGYKFGHKIDIYSFYLTEQFEEIDKKYPNPGDEDNNKGVKGELLACGIIDLTIWLCGFYLGKDYTVIHGFEEKPRGNSVDFKLTCKNKVFLIEAKNWNITTYVDMQTYDQKIKTRFFCDGMNILMIREDKVPAVERMYKQYPLDEGPPTINRKPINYIEVAHFLDKRNDIFDINWNLLFGVIQLTAHIGKTIDLEREFSLEECIQMGMPTWFLTDYFKKHKRTVSRRAGKIGYNRKRSEFKQLTKYRNILDNYTRKHKFNH